MKVNTEEFLTQIVPQTSDLGHIWLRVSLKYRASKRYKKNIKYFISIVLFVTNNSI